jgi:hypothetical protein
MPFSRIAFSNRSIVSAGEKALLFVISPSDCMKGLLSSF